MQRKRSGHYSRRSTQSGRGKKNLRNSDAEESGMKSKSTSKPLRDVSNAKVAGNPANSMEKNTEDFGGKMGDESFDRLLLVQSDISSLARQIDELVVQALQLTGDKGREEIKEFADALSDMQTSLKPWVPRLQKALFSQSTETEHKSEQSMEGTVPHVPEENKNAIFESPKQTKLVSLVSPSPLVSWQAKCDTEGGRQLFLLTPLPQKGLYSLNRQSTYIPAIKNVESEENDCPGLAAYGPNARCGKFSEVNCLSNFIMTPCLRMSPPKSCVLLEPISEFAKKKTLVSYKSTPFPTRAQDSGGPEASESSSHQSSDNLAVKYPELFGIRLNDLEKKTNEENSPDWIVSPPKTCIIMEPADEKLLENTCGNGSGLQKDGVCYQQNHLSAVKKVDYQGDHATGCELDSVWGTPAMKETVSSFRTGNQPGENTLKRELWTRFEAATIFHGIRRTILQETATKKGFLERLDEALES